MNYSVFINRTILLSCIVLPTFFSASCKKFVDIGAPATQIDVQGAFQNDISATSAIIGLYTNNSINDLTILYSGLCGASADEIRYAVSDPTYDQFANDALLAGNSLNSNNLWAESYAQIFQINTAIENLSASQVLSPSVKNQLLGEAKTWRAMIYFYLVNLYDDVPLLLTTNTFENGRMGRTPADSVLTQIKNDLTDAVSLLTTTYPTAQRARINKYAAMCLLAKAYLYTKDWKTAEQIADQTISSGLYTLEPDLNSVFVNTSNEVIWQIATTTGTSVFGSNFLATKGVLPTYIMYDELYQSFEPGDSRKEKWTANDTIGGKAYYYVNKYKQASGAGNEYNVVFRLAEQYLIRSEARLQQDKIADGIGDINATRNRAGLPSLDDAMSKGDALLALEHEKRLELFAEWGNRWFDLKRMTSVSGGPNETRADEVLGAIKPSWKHQAIFYPIPSDQIIANPNLKQNEGY